MYDEIGQYIYMYFFLHSVICLHGNIETTFIEHKSYCYKLIPNHISGDIEILSM